ncbi:protein URA1 [Catenaria anguillulae PL171]|uniref:Protein URA1 n=1 Tax=Catenaria anguillulae PL171 TaxID=765915 RepID=A0A1Y2I3N8_9FUNG|nr:protein URA1 [Catenaria anguillulae PL171]
MTVVAATILPPTTVPCGPACTPNAADIAAPGGPVVATLTLADGSAYQGYSFGAQRSIAGECVFQTGMVGYVESLTDPSYSGQLLVLTYPLIGNYGVPSRDSVEKDLANLKVHLESSRIHIAGLIVGQYSQEYSHWLATSSLADWLKENNVPGIYGIDTRAITKKIRTKGVLLGKLLFPKSDKGRHGAGATLADYEDLPFSDPNTTNLVAQVSTKTVTVYPPTPKPKLAPNGVLKSKARGGKALRVLAVDVGMKFNQIRCFAYRGVELKVVPWDYDFVADQDYDGLFISNGPGDPTMVQTTIARLRTMLERKSKPIFGICLGHQLMALAAGRKPKSSSLVTAATTFPARTWRPGRCHITSQTTVTPVIAKTLPQGWKELFVNANDGSNEGIAHTDLPYFSVQFHPESTPGPRDTEYLFDKFIANVVRCAEAGKLVAPPATTEAEIVPSKLRDTRVHVRKVLVLGSGGLSIGQAGEFDYSGSQAIKALKEEGIYTILINPNIATIQTSQGLADKVYFLPVTPQFVRKVIQHERPDGIYVTFGGQTALNCGVQMKDEFAGLGVKVLGTPIRTIELTEDRELFAQSMRQIDERCAESASATTIEDAVASAKKIGFPVICRAAYTLGGLGSGFAENEEQLVALCTSAFASSPQVLIEKSMKGWKEIEYEVVRDSNNNCITVCNMENFDPLGIHTGDSIVVAPSQTLTDEDYMMLRTTAVNVIRHLGVVGECNIQYALNPQTKEYCIIEVNARLSRSSALASKATGYPLAFVAAKLGLGIPLNEIKNAVTRVTCACFEPSLDYCVVKIPRWDLKKFNRVSKKISSQMKSVGEVMAIGRTFEETIQKAIRSVEYSFIGFAQNDYVNNIDEELANPTDLRLFAIANALHQGYTIDRIWELTKIDKWFLNKLANIVALDKHVSQQTLSSITPETMRAAKQIGFSDRQLAIALKSTEMAVREVRLSFGVTPFVKQIDTVAAEFPAMTNYLYMTYNAVEHDVDFTDKGITVIGSGVYRIGSSVEFDWCAVRAIRTLRSNGFKTVMINYNPETVSTDYDEADRLYFENITLERVLDIYEIEQSAGVVLSMGGQTPNNIALPLHRHNVKVLGTSPEMIDSAENRYKFSRMLDKIGVDQPKWKELTSHEEAAKFCEDVGYPVLVRPSYVLSGAAMNVVNSADDLSSYLSQAVAVSRDFPVVISKFIEEAKEIEMDAVAHEGKVVYSVISEHVENAGVHSGDATLVLPPQDLSQETVEKIRVATAKIGHALNVTGPYNIQFIAKDNEIKVIECNVRASRSFPFVSKVMGVDMIEIAVKAMLDLPLPAISVEEPQSVAVKVPQFSFSRLSGADPVLGVEMASTGEVACFGKDKYEAYIKALVATGFKLPKKKNILISIGSYKEKMEFLPSIEKLHKCGFKIFATAGTADFISEHNLPVQYLDVHDAAAGGEAKPEYSLQHALSTNLIDLYINLPSRNKYRRPASYVSRGYKSRRMAVDLAVPLITNVKCAKVFVEALARNPTCDFDVSVVDNQTSFKTLHLPGWVVLNPNRDVKTCLAAGIAACVDAMAVTSSEVTNDLATVARKISTSTKPLVTNAQGAALASLLFLCSMHNKAVHITALRADDVELVSLAKERHVRVTCDAHISQLAKATPNGMYAKYLDVVDAFGVRVGEENDALSQLLTVMNKFGLSEEEVIEKISTAPKRIFDVQVEASVEVEDRPSRATVNRVSVMDKVVYLDGAFTNVALPSLTHVGSVSSSLVPSTPTAASAGILRTPRFKSPAPAPHTDGTVDSEILDIAEVRKRRISATATPAITVGTPGASPLVALHSSLSKSAFYGKHILSVNQFTRSELHNLFGVAQEMRNMVERGQSLDVLQGRVLCTAFYEPSTRTACSFESAWQRLGGNIMGVNQITSSIAKGESFADTVRTLAAYSDCLVLRHPEKGSASQAAKVTKIPVINAGDGTGEHPTQAFLDVFTIREELGSVNGLTITLVGDLKNGRTVHSLVKLLAMYDVKINYCSPAALRMPESITDELKARGIVQRESTNLDDFIGTTDVLYVTRVQKERFASEAEYNAVKDSYIITNDVMTKAKEHMIVMHPLPRVNEISPDVDFDPRAAYFRQMRYGLFVRMALLAMVMGKLS